MTERLLDLIRYITPRVLKLVAAGTFICFVGGMSLRASIAIVAVLALVGTWSRQTAQESFTLYEVKIVPRIGLMLMVLGLITEEDWARLTEKPLPPVPWTCLHLQNGITAVVLSVSSRQGSGNKTVHWTSHNTDTGRDYRIPFSSYSTDRIEYSQPLDFLKFNDSGYPEHGLFDWHPDFFFRQGRDNYEIGIEVANCWWTDNRERLDKAGIAKFLKVSGDASDLRTRITLAVLPRDVFILFNERDWDRKFAESVREQVTKELLLADWRIEDIGFADSIGFFLASVRNFGERYINPYADVGVRLLTF